jgi:hypothetical protein
MVTRWQGERHCGFKMACLNKLHNNSMIMQKPSFGVIVGIALVILAAFIPIVSCSQLESMTPAQSVLDSFMGLSRTVNSTLAFFIAPVLVLAALILVAVVYRRSKSEITTLAVLLVAMPFVVVAKTKANLVAAHFEDAAVNPAAGAYLIWVGAVIILVSTFFTKTDDAA